MVLPSRSKSITGSTGIEKSETRSISSQQSIGLDGNAGGAPPISRMYDVVQIALICRQHKAMLLAKMPNCSEYYFPFAVLKPGESAPSGQQAKLRDILTALSLSKSSLSESILVDLMRIEVPPNNEYILRYTFRVEEKREGSCLCNQLKSPVEALQWLQFEDPPKGFAKNFSKLWAVEPQLMLDKILNSPHPKEDVLQEIDKAEITKYLADEVKSGNNQLSMLLVKLKYDTEALYKCFLEYLNHTYPSVYMNHASFQEFMMKASLLNSHYDTKLLLAAFQIDQNKDASLGYIDFDEFLWGLLFVDLDCPHQKPFAEVRASYIFRYYARKNQLLEYEELAKMAADTEQVCYRGMNAGLGAQKKANDNEVDVFWKEAGMGSKGKGMTYTKFIVTAEKLASKSPRLLNLDMILRGSRPLSSHLQSGDILSRGKNLGKDMVEIVRKRENVCPGCVAKEPVKLAEHTVKAFYNGSVTEVWDNEKWIPDLKREKDKAKRISSNNIFNDQYFPNTIYEAIASHFEAGPIRSATKAARQQAANGNNDQKATKSSTKWSAKFVQKNVKSISGMIAEAETLIDAGGEMVKTRSPVAVVTDLGGKITDLLAVERNISQLLTFMFPIRYVYMLTWNDFSKDGLEMLLLLLACKCLLPDKYHLLLGRNDSKKRDAVRNWLSRQCEALGATQMVDSLMKLLDKLPKCALIDEAVFVVPGVEYVGDVAESLRQVLANYEGPPNGNLKGAAKRKKKPRRKGSKVTPQATTTSVIGNEPAGAASNNPVAPNSSSCFVLYTTTEPVVRKLVYVRLPDEPGAAPIVLGQERAMPQQAQNTQRQLVVLVEADKIRPIYLLNGAKE